MKFVSAEITSVDLPDGRKFITYTACIENPKVLEFVYRYPAYWTRDVQLDGWVSPTVDIQSAPRVSSTANRRED